MRRQLIELIEQEREKLEQIEKIQREVRKLFCHLLELEEKLVTRIEFQAVSLCLRFIEFCWFENRKNLRVIWKFPRTISNEMHMLYFHSIELVASLPTWSYAIN